MRSRLTLQQAHDHALLPEPLVPYRADHFKRDWAAAEDVLTECGTSSGDDAAALSRVEAYFRTTYGPVEGPRHYLRFGAVQAVLGRAWPRLERLGLASSATGHVDDALLQRLLVAPLRMRAGTQEVWIADAYVERAIKASSPVAPLSLPGALPPGLGPAQTQRPALPSAC